MKGLKPQNEIAAAFGSYGWSGEAVIWIIQEFEEMKVKVIDPGLRIQGGSLPMAAGTSPRISRKCSTG